MISNGPNNHLSTGVYNLPIFMIGINRPLTLSETFALLFDITAASWVYPKDAICHQSNSFQTQGKLSTGLTPGYPQPMWKTDIPLDF